MAEKIDCKLFLENIKYKENLEDKYINTINFCINKYIYNGSVDPIFLINIFQKLKNTNFCLKSCDFETFVKYDDTKNGLYLLKYDYKEYKEKNCLDLIYSVIISKITHAYNGKKVELGQYKELYSLMINLTMDKNKINLFYMENNELLNLNLFLLKEMGMYLLDKNKKFYYSSIYNDYYFENINNKYKSSGSEHFWEIVNIASSRGEEATLNSIFKKFIYGKKVLAPFFEDYLSIKKIKNEKKTINNALKKADRKKRKLIEKSNTHNINNLENPLIKLKQKFNKL